MNQETDAPPEALSTLLKRYAVLEDAIDQKVKAHKLTLEPLEGELTQLSALLVERFLAEDVQNLTIPGAGKFNLRTQTHASVKVENRDKIAAWLDEKGLGDLMPRTLNAQTFKKQYRDWEEGDQPLPPAEIVTVFRETKISRTAA